MEKLLNILYRESLINSSYLPYQEFSDYLDTPFPSGLVNPNYITKISITIYAYRKI